MKRSLGLKTGTRALALGTLLACGAIVGCGGGNKPPMGGSGSASGMSGSAGSGSTSGTVTSGSTSGGTGASGMVSSGTMAMMQPCPSPTFAPAAGAVATGSNVVITAPGLPADGAIHFTTDGSTPTDASPIYNSGTIGVQVTGTTETFQAITSGTTCSDSAVVMAVYTISTPEAGAAPTTPAFTPSGTMTTQNNDFTVMLASSAGATICYTLGTTAPTCTATGACGAGAMTYATATPISISATSVTAGQVEVQAIACAADGAASAVGMQQYTLQAATPAMTPAPGAQTYSATLMGALTSATMGATIDYTTNGTAPSCATPVAGQMTYAAPFALQAGTYNVIACKMGYLASAVLGPLTFTVNLTPPTITPAAGTLNVAPTFTVSNAANPAASWVCYSTSATVPACGATGVCTAGTLLPAGGMFTGAIDGATVQAIACAPAGLSNSTVASQGPYKLQLAAPVILPDAATAAAASYTLTAADTTAGHLAHLNVEQATVGTAADQAGGYLCWLQDPGVGITPSCGTTALSCVNGTATAAGPGPFDIEALGPFKGGDSVAVVTCPGTTAATGLGFEGSVASTTVFVGQGQAMPPTITATDATGDTADNWQSQVNVVLTNPNSAAMTVCYTTDGTNPVCTPASVAAGCATVDGTSSQNLNFKVTAPGVGYVNPPTILITPNNCAGNPVATLTTGAVTGIAVTGCMNYATPPAVVVHTGAGAVAAGTAFETVTFNVSNGGSGYSNANKPVVVLTPGDGVGSCATTAVTLTGTSITGITATGCKFDQNPVVSFDTTGTTGAGAVATAAVTQTVTFTGAQITSGGNYYTANPAVTGLTPASGKGTCTTLGAVETNGVVTAVTATGCSGFTDFGAGDIAAVFASQGPADGSANAAAAIAVPGNSVSVPAIQNNPTTLKTIACNAGLGSSPIIPATYHTQLADPTIVATDTLTSAPVVALVGGSTPTNTTVTAGDTVTIATQSDFTDTKLVYTIDGTIPNCTGTGTAFTGVSTTIAVPDPTMTPLDIHVIACGANQLAAAVVHRSFVIAVAAPVVTSKVGTIVLGSGTDSVATTNVPPAQNAITATITSPTAGSWICYSTDGVTVPTCGTAAAMCPGGTNLPINGITGTVAIGASAKLSAVACKGALSSTITGPVVYTLDVTQATVVGTPTAACPSVATVGFDYALPANTNVGGPTTGAVLCFSTTAQPTCNAGGTCFTPTMAAPTKTVSLSETGQIFTFACKTAAGFTPSSAPLNVAVTAFAPPVITVDGTLDAAEWSAALGDQFPSVTAADHGGFTFGQTTVPGDTLYFSQSGFTAAAGTDIVIYLADTATALAAVTRSTGVTALGAGALGFGAQYAIDINTRGATGCSGVGATKCAVTTYTNNGNANADVWTAQAAGTIPVTAAVTANALEASLGTAAVGAIGDAFDVTGVVYNGAALSGGWSKTAGGAQSYVDTYSSLSCATPLMSLH